MEIKHISNVKHSYVDAHLPKTIVQFKQLNSMLFVFLLQKNSDLQIRYAWKYVQCPVLNLIYAEEGWHKYAPAQNQGRYQISHTADFNDFWLVCAEEYKWPPLMALYNVIIFGFCYTKFN